MSVSSGRLSPAAPQASISKEGYPTVVIHSSPDSISAAHSRTVEEVRSQLSNTAADTSEAESSQVLNEILWAVYANYLGEEPGAKPEALRAYNESLQFKDDPLENPRNAQRLRAPQEGLVDRRAPLNPLASPRLGRYRQKLGKKPKNKVDDPALRNNPLRGRLILLLTTSSVLFFVYLQALCLNASLRDDFPQDGNGWSTVGNNESVLLAMGGLNANRIRNFGESYRLFWAMWMHSGWLHIGINLLCQLQYLFMFEPDWGFCRTLFVYWISGVSGNLMSVVCNPCSTTVGASGALFGLMGAMVPYCLEFWRTIPRPGCLLLFSIVVALASVATGFSKTTDNWAHMGGLLGGVLAGFATTAVLLPQKETNYSKSTRAGNPRTQNAAAIVSGTQGGRSNTALASGKSGGPVSRAMGASSTPKKVVRRGRLSRFCQRHFCPSWRCGAREWCVRIIAIALLGTFWGISFSFIYVNYKYQPLGAVTYSGILGCTCCMDPTAGGLGWSCDYTDVKVLGTGTLEQYCKSQYAQTVQDSLRGASRQKRSPLSLPVQYQASRSDESFFDKISLHGLSGHTWKDPNSGPNKAARTRGALSPAMEPRSAAQDAEREPGTGFGKRKDYADAVLRKFARTSHPLVSGVSSPSTDLGRGRQLSAVKEGDADYSQSFSQPEGLAQAATSECSFPASQSTPEWRIVEEELCGDGHFERYFEPVGLMEWNPTLQYYRTLCRRRICERVLLQRRLFALYSMYPLRVLTDDKGYPTTRDGVDVDGSLLASHGEKAEKESNTLPYPSEQAPQLSLLPVEKYPAAVFVFDMLKNTGVLDTPADETEEL